MIHEYFTAKEIATAIQELGFQAKIVDDDNRLTIESASSGKKWTAALHGVDPFFNSMFLRIIIWVPKDPLEWANKWNSSNCSSMAHVLTLDDESPPTPDDDGDYMTLAAVSVFVSTYWRLTNANMHDDLVVALWTSPDVVSFWCWFGEQ